MLNLNEVEDIKAYKISEGVVLYKDVFKNIDDILSFFKEAESYKEDTYMMKKFEQWGQYGTMAEVDSDSFHNFTLKFFNPFNPEEKKQKAIFEKLSNAYKFVKEDFMTKYGSKNIWPSHYSKANIWNEASNTKIAFLKYDHKNVIQGNKIKYNFTAFHSDFFQQDMDTPGYKLIFTVMIYLNDDYDGGEICFWDGEKIVGYKPKAGDIVAFPSCEPFYHGVLDIDKNDRYAIRMNYCSVTDGSEEFKSGNFTPSLNYTNYKVGYRWIDNGVEVIVNPGVKETITVDPPLMLTVDQMEETLIDAKN